MRVGGFTPFAVATFTRPANTTAYADGDIMANSTTAASVVPLLFPVGQFRTTSGIVTGADICKSSATTTNATFRLHLFDATPFAAGSFPADNAALTSTFLYDQRRIGFFDFSTWFTGTNTAWSQAAPTTRTSLAFNTGGYQVSNNETQVQTILGPVMESRCIYGLLEAKAAYTPTSGEQFTIRLDTQADT